MNFRSAKPTRDDVHNLYRLLLNRAPDSEAIVDHWLHRSPSLAWLVDQFLSCEEFSVKHRHLLDKTTLVDHSRLKALIEQLASRHAKRELYQPIYGLNIKHDGPIQRECAKRCELVLEAMKGLPIGNMSVVDVGCNMGYVTFYLSNYFSRAVGLEHDRLLYDFCVELKQNIDTKAEFEKTDFFASYEELAGSYDLCLLFSVIHYLVAAKGIVEAKKVLSDIVSRFDYVMIELSSKKDYPYMPHDPKEMLSELRDVDCTLLGISEKNDRPIYLSKKKVIGSSKWIVDRAVYTPIRADSCTRIYHSDNMVVKVLPLAYKNNLKKYHNEVAAYQILRGGEFVTELLGSGCDRGIAWICTRRISGRILNHLYSECSAGIFESESDKEVILCKLLMIVAEMLTKDIYWNDLSTHNILITDGSLKIIDFGESGKVELHDHIAMLTWLMHDLQIERAASYAMPVYGEIHGAGQDRARSRALRFRPSQGFFSPGLQNIYDKIADMEGISEFFGPENDLLDHVRERARDLIRLRE